MRTVAFELLQQAVLHIRNKPICHNPTLHRESCHTKTGHTDHLVRRHLEIGILADGAFLSLGFPGITNVDTGCTDTQVAKFLDLGCLDDFSFCGLLRVSLSAPSLVLTHKSCGSLALWLSGLLCILPPISSLVYMYVGLLFEYGY